MNPITGLLGGTALSAGSSLLSGLFGSSAAKQASAQQQQSSMMQMLMLQQMFQQQQANLQPFMNMGIEANKVLQAFMPEFMTSFAPTMEQLEGTPGYQFAKDQGLKATQNAFAAKGLGQSGAALKGAATFAKDLASTTFQQQFQNYWAEKLNKFNALFPQVQLGANTAIGAGQQIGQFAGALSGTMGQFGAAGAAGTVGSANALMGGLGGAAGGLGSALMLAGLSGMYGGGGAGTPTATQWGPFGLQAPF